MGFALRSLFTIHTDAMASGIHHLIGTVEPTPAAATNGHHDSELINGSTLQTKAPSASTSAQVHTNGLSVTNGQPATKTTDADSSSFKLGDFSIDEYRPMKVVVIGAGFSGIIAGIRCVTCDLMFSFSISFVFHA